MRILLTGASGFLGKECMRHLTLDSHQIITTDKVGDVDFLGDLSDASFVVQLPEVDVVINCAAVQYVSEDLPVFNRLSYFRRNNIDSVFNLCNRYRDQNIHFVHIGTSMMYKQDGRDLYTIDAEKSGAGVYSLSKMLAQKIVDQMPVSSTVIPCIIGGEGREGLFRGFVTMMKRYGYVVFPGNGDHKINMVHVYDVASLISKIVSIRALGFFNAAAEDPLSIREWVKEIADEIKIKNVRCISLPLQPIKILARFFGYRGLAYEQLLMLEFPHVLSIRESLAIGWKPRFSNAKIARDIALYISRES